MLCPVITTILFGFHFRQVAPWSWMYIASIDRSEAVDFHWDLKHVSEPPQKLSWASVQPQPEIVDSLAGTPLACGLPASHWCTWHLMEASGTRHAAQPVLRHPQQPKTSNKKITLTYLNINHFKHYMARPKGHCKYCYSKIACGHVMCFFSVWYTSLCWQRSLCLSGGDLPVTRRSGTDSILRFWYLLPVWTPKSFRGSRKDSVHR